MTQANGLQVTTGSGEFRVQLEAERAPKTCRYFAELAAAGRLDGSSVFRVVTPDNEPEEHNGISVVQLGLWSEDQPERVLVPHESTEMTGLEHRQWTVSAARFEVGELYGSFFVCMRDEPCLDHGGTRNPDEAGFAAFGRVVDGHETLHALYRQAEPAAMLTSPIPVHSVQPLLISCKHPD